MQYHSTRSNHPPVSPAMAINLGMVPRGGLFVPQTVPKLDIATLAGADYQQTARAVLGSFLTDFTPGELDQCIGSAYNGQTFSAPDIIELAALGERRTVMELWHGPTAAFKDVALQIMPHFLVTAKNKVGERSHTVILVATSGDTGKAALEGFKDCEGISIIVFYPHGGVSEIQRLQMATTDGSNTAVIAVEGNFDDCQNGVKQLFCDEALGASLAERGIVFSSANSINWGRLCPQIVYYFHAYLMLARRGGIALGQEVNFCVPTGNFGNILAGYYARAMGLPVKKFICASNQNNILADFFATGIYDRNRPFFRTTSPSMDILISSNLERFLFEITGHDGHQVAQWYEQLGATGRFAVDSATRAAMDECIAAGWVDEQRVKATIARTFRDHRYVLDTHSAVAVAVDEDFGDSKVPTIIDSTASPYKFSADVLGALSEERFEDEFASIQRLSELSATPIHRGVQGLREKPLRHSKVIALQGMKDAVIGELASRLA